MDIARKGETDIHLVITDVIMSDMNGRELVNSIFTSYPGIKYLFMSGYTADVISRRGVLNDDLQFIQKPFSMGDLTRAVRKALGEKKTHPSI
jgi:DNA-binding NtrC family response regulator